MPLIDTKTPVFNVHLLENKVAWLLEVGMSVSSGGDDVARGEAGEDGGRDGRAGL